VRILTRTEAVVVQLLLARSRGPVARVPGIEMPHRRTLQSVRQRAYQRGWVRDRYVPAPAAFGLDRATFALARPHADSARALVEAWRARPENVLLWASDAGVFGAFFSRSGGETDLASELGGGAEASTVHLLESATTQQAIPVYFDFEMAWVRATGLTGVSRECPRPLAAPRLGADGPPSALPSPTQRTAIRAWVADLERTHGPRPSVFPLLRPRIEEQSLRLGWVEFRPILDPGAVAAAVTGFPAWCAFVHGRLQPRAEPSELFRALVGEAGVSPFLFATDGGGVLFAALSRGPGVRRPPERLAILPLVGTYLREISVEQWPLGATRPVTDHEYARCLDAGTGL
jgi:hypothetical protein